MKLARLYLPDEAVEVLAIEHDGSFYRADLLDRAMGCPFPGDLEATTFGRRALALGPWTLEEHHAAIVGGAELADTVASEFHVLPPARDRAAILEMRDAGPAIAWRVSPSLYGAGDVVMTKPRGALFATPAVAVVLGEDLRAAPPSEVHDAFVGLALAIAWVSGEAEADAAKHGLPASVARELGTHLGPTLNVMPPMGLEVVAATRGAAREVRFTLDPEAIATAVSRISEHDELRAGDVVLSLSDVRIAAVAGEAVVIDAGALGRLVGTVGA